MKHWESTLGRVSFINCDPLYHGLSEKWNTIVAPPSWLTGHLLRQDCLLAPIPAADYAAHFDELALIPDIGISSRGEVGSVLLFGNRPIEKMRDIAFPSDSSTSVKLMKHILELRNLNPRPISMGPDLETMLDRCDGALLIGDRALKSATEYPSKVVMDLGAEWFNQTNHPMVFGVFAARRDTDLKNLKKAHQALINQLELFETQPIHRKESIAESSRQSGQTVQRLQSYYGEVINRMWPEDYEGLAHFLKFVCGIDADLRFAWE